MKVNRFTRFLGKRKRRTFKNIFPWCMVLSLILSAVLANYSVKKDTDFKEDMLVDYIKDERSHWMELLNHDDYDYSDINIDALGTRTYLANDHIWFFYTVPPLSTMIISPFFHYKPFWIWCCKFHAKFFEVNIFDCIIVSYISDEQGNYYSDNINKMHATVLFQKPPDADNSDDLEHYRYYYDLHTYTCDMDKLGNEELFKIREDYDKYNFCDSYAEYETGTSYRYEVNSIYVNPNDKTFVPHEIEVTKGKRVVDEDGNEIEPTDAVTEKIVIDFDDSNYQLINNKVLQSEIDNGEAVYPAFNGVYFSPWHNNYKEFVDALRDYQTIPNDRDKYERKAKYEDFLALKEDMENIETVKDTIKVNDQEFDYVTYYTFEPILKRQKYVFIRCLIDYFLLLTIISLIYSVVKSFLNKASHAMEDYQRTLTNKLANDLKTPLAAIGDYAEDLIEQRKDSADEKELRYLGSIKENVAYTDSMIKKTLKLAEIDKMQKLVISKVSLRDITENAFGKYRLQLEERNITLSINGDTTVEAEEATITDAIENLVSNAVKYTRKDGCITVNIQDREYRITNDVTQKIDTSELKKPFVKGDSSRHDKNSSGLGLSIAESALNRNGYRLTISCDDSQFTAVVKL